MSTNGVQTTFIMVQVMHFIDKFVTNNKHNIIENLGKNLTNEQEIHQKIYKKIYMKISQMNKKFIKNEN